MSREELLVMRAQIQAARAEYERDVNDALNYVRGLAASIALAIGEISPDEGKAALVREFAKKLRVGEP